MIYSFKCKETKKIWEGSKSNKLPNDIQQLARRKLRILNNAKTLNDLRLPPGNHLEMLKGDRKEQYSIRINQQWRLCFKWQVNSINDVEIIDYH